MGETRLTGFIVIFFAVITAMIALEMFLPDESVRRLSPFFMVGIGLAFLWWMDRSAKRNFEEVQARLDAKKAARERRKARRKTKR